MKHRDGSTPGTSVTVSPAFATLVSRACKVHGTQAVMARRAGLSEATVSKMKRKTLPFGMGMTTFRKLANVMGVDESAHTYIITDDGMPTDDDPPMPSPTPRDTQDDVVDVLCDLNDYQLRRIAAYARVIKAQMAVTDAETTLDEAEKLLHDIEMEG